MSQFKVEYLNDHGDWVLKSWHKGEDKAEIVASVCQEAGYKTRIVHEGKIIRSGEGD
jgi:hypothetical protein